MTAFEIISIFIGILALLMSFGSLIVTLLAFFDKRNKDYRTKRLLNGISHQHVLSYNPYRA